MRFALLIVIIFAVIALAIVFPDLTTDWNGFANTTVHSVTANITTYTAQNNTVVYGMPDIQDLIGGNLWLIGVAVLAIFLGKAALDIFKRNDTGGQ
jgi:hypothetical protein